MKVDDLSLEKIFEPTERLEAPLFQRPYVWKKDENWQPLWESVQALAEARLKSGSVHPHFLGTIVLEQLITSTGKTHARQIIDGQQRLTTLQLALAAIRDFCSNLEGDAKRYGKAIEKLTDNYVPLSDEPQDKFKVWPTNADQNEFREVMKARSHEAVKELPHQSECLIKGVYLYFRDVFLFWLKPQESADFLQRLEALYLALKEDVHMVVIDLEKSDDPQVIFETLNALGTPLLPADLVKNYLFHLSKSQGQDTRTMYTKFWEAFDTEKSYWRKDVRQGRLKRARLDLFLKHYLTMMTGKDVRIPHLFSSYRQFVQTNDGESALRHMELFRLYADVYKSFDEFPADTRAGLFFYRLRQFDTSTVYPLLLEVFKRYDDNEGRENLESILIHLESFLVRRAVCQLTPKNYNRFFAEMVKALRGKDDFSVTAIRDFLLEQTSDTSRWPNDEEFLTQWTMGKFYKKVKRDVARMILETMDAALHTGKTEKIVIGERLTIEHLLPIEWQEYWPLPRSDEPPEKRKEAIELRNLMLHTIGNLTLLTKKLNPAVSNGPWNKKRSEILKHSALNLNRALPEKWNEISIKKRSEELFELVKKLWPHPGNNDSRKPQQ